jgi:hypothetical protein
MRHAARLGGDNRVVGGSDFAAFSGYIEFLEVVNPGPQNRITLVA